MATLSPVPAMQDLKVTFQQCTLIFPSQQTEKRSIFLSNMDQILNYNIPTAHFFSPSQDFPPQNVSKILKLALEKVLVPYDFMAGRLKLNNKTGCLELDCNVAGAGFVVASSEITLDEIRDFLAHPNLGFQQLALQRLDHLQEVDQPLYNIIQMWWFAIGMSTNHLLFDGSAAKTFLDNLASQAFDGDKPLQVIPCNNRRLLAARSPPRVTFQHPEFLQLDLPIGQGSSPPVFDCLKEDLEIRIFKFDSSHINQLKDKVKFDDHTDNGKSTSRISSFSVVAASIWRCKALSQNKDCYKKDTISTLLNAIDIKSRLNPPLPSSYSGNAVLPIGVSATLEEVKTGPFSKIVEMISEGAKRMTDEYAKSAFDWLELHRGIPHGDYVVASWLRLGFDQVEYPWGKPLHSCPVVNHRKDICWVFPNTIDGGISAMVSLPPEEMVTFEALFHKIFA